MFPFFRLILKAMPRFCFGSRVKKLKYEKKNIHSPHWKSNPQLIRYSHTVVLLPHVGLYDFLNLLFLLFLCFMLYVSRTQLGRRGNVVLRHSVLRFPPNSGGTAGLVAELNAALCIDIRGIEWGIESTTCCFYSHTFASPPR